MICLRSLCHANKNINAI